MSIALLLTGKTPFAVLSSGTPHIPLLQPNPSLSANSSSLISSVSLPSTLLSKLMVIIQNQIYTKFHYVQGFV